MTRETKKGQKYDDNVILANYDVIVTFPIGGQFGAIQELETACKVKYAFSIVLIFYLARTKTRTKKSPTQLLHYFFE